jgi:hypothetical protein
MSVICTACSWERWRPAGVCVTGVLLPAGRRRSQAAGPTGRQRFLRHGSALEADTVTARSSHCLHSQILGVRARLW